MVSLTNLCSWSRQSWMRAIERRAQTVWSWQARLTGGRESTPCSCLRQSFGGRGRVTVLSAILPSLTVDDEDRSEALSCGGGGSFITVVNSSSLLAMTRRPRGQW